MSHQNLLLSFLKICVIEKSFKYNNQQQSQNIMESTLRKTLIKIQSGQELHFWKITKFNKFGCKAMFYDPLTKNVYDVTVLTKSLLQLNSFSQLINQNIKRYRNLTARIICPIYTVTQDGDIMYIISKAERYKLSDLIQKRQGITEFQILYFLLDLIQLMNFLRQRHLFYQIIELDEIYLNKNMKMLIPFSIWVANSQTNAKPIALRHQDKKKFIAPQFLENNCSICADQVNAWNTGIFIYQLIQATKPFQGNNSQLIFTKQISVQILQLVKGLLKRSVQQRLKFPLIVIQDVFKKYPSLPHILPTTIFSCPPSSQYISEYTKNFYESNQQKDQCQNKILNVRTQYCIEDETTQYKQKMPVKNFKSYKHIKPSDRSLTESKVYITEFVDISHTFGYGYQMNTGLICFVFNDGSEMYFQNSSKKLVTQVTQKKGIIKHVYQKINQQSEIKKKLFILEAYAKSIKKYKHNLNTNNKVVTVSQYVKTQSAAVFLMTNQTVQIIFNDKIIFLLSKRTIFVQNKNLDKFEPFQSLQQNPELVVRKKYSLVMAERLFHWDISELQRLNCKSQQPKSNINNGNHNIQTENFLKKNNSNNSPIKQIDF